MLGGGGERAGEQMRGVLLLANGFPDWIGDFEVAGPHRDRNELFRVAHRQRAQQHRVHETEDRGVRADAQREREYGDDREGRTPPQRANRIADIRECAVEPGEKVNVACPLFLRGRIARLPVRSRLRVALAHAGRDEFIAALRDMMGEFAIQIV